MTHEPSSRGTRLEGDCGIKALQYLQLPRSPPPQALSSATLSPKWYRHSVWKCRSRSGTLNVRQTHRFREGDVRRFTASGINNAAYHWVDNTSC